MKVYDDHSGKNASYTIISTSNAQIFEISVATHSESVVGRSLHQKKKGDQIKFKGPKGDFIVRLTQEPKVFLVKEIGITPCIGMLQDLLEHEISAEIFIYNFLEEDFSEVFRDRLSEFNQTLSIHYFIIREGDFPQRFLSGQLDEEIMEEILVGRKNAEFYISGETKFCKRIKRRLQDNKTSNFQIFTEGFG